MTGRSRSFRGFFIAAGKGIPWYQIANLRILFFVNFQDIFRTELLMEGGEMNTTFAIRYLRREHRVFLVGLFITFLCLLPCHSARCEDTNDAEMRKEIEELRSKIMELDSLKAKLPELEEKMSSKSEVSVPGTVKEELIEGKKEEEKSEKKELVKISSPYLGDISITGGLSGGYFAGNNEGEGGKKDNFVLTNLLIDITSEIKDGMFGFNLGLGGVTTPSVLGSPDDTLPDFRIEYASINLKPIKSLQGLSFRGGLLQPNSGYEATYTFNNRNITVGALASQQPYNAMGARAEYDFSEDFRIWSSIFKHRLARDEYETEYGNGQSNVLTKNVQDSYSWEAGMCDNIGGVGLSLYHYHLTDLRYLTGISAEYTINNVYMALNADYWRWSSQMQPYFDDDSSIGVALYLAPSFGKFMFPLRLEYIDQGKSEIYLPSPAAESIYAATLTPTYNFTDNVLIRTEGSYVHADNGFSDGSGRPKDNKFLFSTEVVFKF
jgi:hypothetical protein